MLKLLCCAILYHAMLCIGNAKLLGYAYAVLYYLMPMPC